MQLNGIQVLKQDGFFQKYNSLKRVDFSNNQITKIEVGAFKGGESLKELLVVKTSKKVEQN